MIRASSPSGADIDPGIIVAWSSGTLPDGWVECDGTNGTDDYRERLLRGVAVAESVGDTGGATTHDHTGGAHAHAYGTYAAAHSHLHTFRLPNHRHGLSSVTASGHTHCIELSECHSHVSSHSLDAHDHTDTLVFPCHYHDVELVSPETCTYITPCTTPSATYCTTDGASNYVDTEGPSDLAGDVCTSSSAPATGSSSETATSMSGDTESTTPTIGGFTGYSGTAGLAGVIDSATPAVSGTTGMAGAVDTTTEDNMPPYTNVIWIMKL